MYSQFMMHGQKTLSYKYTVRTERSCLC